MRNELEKAVDVVRANPAAFLSEMKKRYAIYHRSNVFFRDIQYGLQDFLLSRGLRCNYGDSERLAAHVVTAMVESGILKKVDDGTWWVDAEEFRLPIEQKSAAAKASN